MSIQSIEMNHSPLEGTALEYLSEPSILLPSQYVDQRRPYELSPEARLRLAILEDAINCWCTRVNAPRYTKSHQMVTEAHLWIFEGGGTVTFDDCCEALKIDADWLRTRLLAVKRPLKLPRILPSAVKEKAQLDLWVQPVEMTD